MNNLNPYISKWLQQTSDKDKRALTILAVFSAIVSLIYFIALPAHHYRENQHNAYIDAVKTNAWIVATAPQVKGTSVSTQESIDGISSESMVDIINFYFKKHHITIKRIQTNGDSSIALWLENVAFGSAIAAIYDANMHSTIDLEEFSLTRPPSRAAGISNIRTTFKSK